MTSRIKPALIGHGSWAGSRAAAPQRALCSIGANAYRSSLIVRRAWIVGGSLVVVVLLAGGTFNVVNTLAHQVVTETKVFPLSGIDVLDVRSPNGTIEVLGGDVDEITVTARISRGLQRTPHREVVNGSTLELRSSCPGFGTWCDVDYRVEVPADITVRANTDNGRLIVRDIAGPVTADSDNGSVDLARLSGRVEASTDNGSVVAVGLRSGVVTAESNNGRVLLEFADPPDAVEARTDNGRVEVEVPETEDTYLVTLDTDNGSTDIGVRTDPASERTIVGTSDNGDVTVRYSAG